MKLYELERDTYFTLEGHRFIFKKVDGMYSICLDEEGNIHHIAAFADIEPETKNAT